MQFQADMLNTKVERPEITETTVMGAAYLAGICVGLWKQEDVLSRRKIDKEFTPIFTSKKREKLYKRLQKDVERSKNWID
jgi:glycerol kinase